MSNLLSAVNVVSPSSCVRVDPLDVRLEVPLAIALVAAVRTALRLVLATGGSRVLH